jgi:pyruvate dehydrogenase E1 component beta subunit
VAAHRREGTDVSLIGYGSMMREVAAAGEMLAAQGVSPDVIDLRSLVPFDAELVIDSAQRTGRVVIVQEAPRSAGFAAEVAAQIQEKALYSLNAPIERVTGYDTIVPLRRAEKHFVPSVERVVAAAHRTLEG